MPLFFGIAYFLVGLFQFFAVWDGVAYGLGIGKFFSFIVSLFITYIPLLGSIVGVYGAVNVWHWTLVQAGLLFFWYVPIYILMMFFGALSRR